MKQLDNYLSVKQSLYDYFGFIEDWVVYPLRDCRDYYWKIEDGMVCFADTENELEEKDGNYYESDIYTQRFYDKHVYEGAEYTMIFVDIHTDGMKYFDIFDNSKRIQITGSGVVSNGIAMEDHPGLKTKE